MPVIPATQEDHNWWPAQPKLVKEDPFSSKILIFPPILEENGRVHFFSFTCHKDKAYDHCPLLLSKKLNFPDCGG
jgi:hypothetical protein